mgnify:FL=1
MNLQEPLWVWALMSAVYGAVPGGLAVFLAGISGFSTPVVIVAGIVGMFAGGAAISARVMRGADRDMEERAARAAKMAAQHMRETNAEF